MDVLVQNGTARVLGPSYPTKAGGDIVRLLPGVNRVAAEQWTKVQNDPLVVVHLEQGLLTVLNEDAELAKLPLTRAVDIVRGTYDQSLLRAWQESESGRGAEARTPVLEAIGAQLDRLDGSKTPAEEQPTTAPSSPLGLAPSAGVDVSAPRGRRR